MSPRIGSKRVFFSLYRFVFFPEGKKRILWRQTASDIFPRVLFLSFSSLFVSPSFHQHRCEPTPSGDKLFAIRSFERQEKLHLLPSPHRKLHSGGKRCGNCRRRCPDDLRRRRRPSPPLARPRPLPLLPLLPLPPIPRPKKSSWSASATSAAPLPPKLSLLTS